MKNILLIVSVIVLCFSLSSCFSAANQKLFENMSPKEETAENKIESEMDFGEDFEKSNQAMDDSSKNSSDFAIESESQAENNSLESIESQAEEESGSDSEPNDVQREESAPIIIYEDAVSLETALDSNGLYLEIEEDYYIPFSTQNNKSKSFFLCNGVLLAPENEEQPIYTLSNPITVIYCNNADISNDIFKVNEIITRGYTPNFYIDKRDNTIGNNNLSIEGFSINGKLIDELLKETLDLDKELGNNSKKLILSSEKNKEYTVGYYEGTTYHSQSFFANHEFFLIDYVNCQKIKKESLAMSQKGYAYYEFELKPGMYYFENYLNSGNGIIIEVK